MASLVRSEIVFYAERGDTVEVKNMPFVEPSMDEIETPLFDLNKGDILRLAELIGLLFLALIAIFLVVRPALAKLTPEPVTLDAPAAGGIAGGGTAGAGSGGGGGAGPGDRGLPALAGGHVQASLPVSIASGGGAAGDGFSPQDGSSLPSSRAGGMNGGDAAGSAELEESSRLRLIEQARNAIEARPDEAAAVVEQWIGSEAGERRG
jgi:flagellar biosynthesis/type III secretory pathway M-ring protein FliF/YscJ